MDKIVNADDVGMSQFEAALCLVLELIKRRAILNHEIGKKFERDIALQFFVACQPDNPHPPSPQDLDQRVAAKDSLSAGKLTRRRACDIACAFVSHLDRIYILRWEESLKLEAEPLRRLFGFARTRRSSLLQMRHFAFTMTFW